MLYLITIAAQILQITVFENDGFELATTLILLALITGGLQFLLVLLMLSQFDNLRLSFFSQDSVSRMASQ